MILGTISLLPVSISSSLICRQGSSLTIFIIIVELTVGVLAHKDPVCTEITKRFIKDMEDACNKRAKELGVGREICFLVN